MILPAKLVNERLMFVIDYGDKLPWGSVITLAKITVDVSSGTDPSPQRVFSQTWDIDGTKVTYQVRQGLPGVIYNLNTAVHVAGEWLHMTMKLAVMPDSGDVGALYPLTRIFTSLPYYQYIQDGLDFDVAFVDAFTQGIFVAYTVPAESLDIDLAFVSGETRPIYWTYALDDGVDLGLAFESALTSTIFRTYTPLPEGVDLDFALAAASTARVLLTQTQEAESIDIDLAFVSALTEVA